MFVTLHSPKMGMLCLVYPFKMHVLRLVRIRLAYPSAAEMWFNRRRKQIEKEKNIIVSKIKK